MFVQQSLSTYDFPQDLTFILIIKNCVLLLKKKNRTNVTKLYAVDSREFSMPQELTLGYVSFEIFSSVYPNTSKYVNMDVQQNEMILSIDFNMLSSLTKIPTNQFTSTSLLDQSLCTLFAYIRNAILSPAKYCSKWHFHQGCLNMLISLHTLINSDKM